MLSRIAESLFWIGRYLERAEDTCRIVEVHLQLLLDDPSVDQEAAGQSLLEVMGEAPAEGRPADAQYVLTTLCYDADSAASVAAALGGARESARRARETVSTEMWESINTTWNSVRGGRLQRMRPATAFKLIRERCAVISGTADSTMSHDEGVGRLAPGLGPEVDGHRLGLGQHHRLAARHPPLDRHLVGPVGHQVVEDAAVDHPAVHVLRPGKRPPF